MNEPKTTSTPPGELPSDVSDGGLIAARGVVITHEDIDRAHDRERVLATRTQHGPWSRARLLWLLIGPGILVMLGDNDGPSMLSYAATGARFEEVDADVEPPPPQARVLDIAERDDAAVQQRQLKI